MSTPKPPKTEGREDWHSRLTLAREARRMKQAELARLHGAKPPTISDWESGGIKAIEAENMLKLCKILEVDPYWLMFGAPYGEAPITGKKSPLTDEAFKLISWVERVDALGGPARKLFGHIYAALEVAGTLTQEQNPPRKGTDIVGTAGEKLAPFIDKSGGKESAAKKHKP